MKKVVYRDILGENPRKKEVSVEESFDHRERVVTKKWISKYFVKEKFSSAKKEDLERWISDNRLGVKEKNCHILRHADTSSGENMVMCKVLGVFFLVVGNTAYKIVYVNEVKVYVRTSEKAD